MSLVINFQNHYTVFNCCDCCLVEFDFTVQGILRWPGSDFLFHEIHEELVVEESHIQLWENDMVNLWNPPEIHMTRKNHCVGFFNLDIILQCAKSILMPWNKILCIQLNLKQILWIQGIISPGFLALCLAFQVDYPEICSDQSVSSEGDS